MDLSLLPFHQAKFPQRDDLAMTRSRAPLRIVHYLHTIRLAHGGVVRAVLDLCTTLSDRGHDVTLITANAEDAPPEWSTVPRQRQPNLVEVRPGPNVPSLVKRHIESSQVIHLHGPWDPYNLAIARLARQLRIPYVVTTHGMLDDWSMAQKTLKKRVYHALFAKRLLEGARFVHCTAQAELEQAQRWFKRGRGFVLPYVVDFSPFLSLPGAAQVRERYPFLADGPIKLLFLSRLHCKKGVERLIDAAALLKSQGLDFKLIIAGPGEASYVRALERRVARLGLVDRTHFVGLISGTDKLSLYQACDLFVLPTSQENFGLVLAEAMACETPVLTTRGTDIWREIESGGALICDADATSLASTITTLALDRPAMVQRGKDGRAWIMRFFDTDRLLDSYEAFYEQSLIRKQGESENRPQRV